MGRVTINEEVLRWALNRSELTEDLTLKKFPKIPQWLEGEAQPTLRQLEKLAKATFTPLGFFFLKEPPIDRLSIPHFRTLDNEEVVRPSPNLVDTLHIMEQRQAWIREYIIEQGQERLSYAGSVKLDEEFSSISQRMRHTLSFDEDWAAQHPTWEKALVSLRQAMEDLGILVVVNGVVGNNTNRKLNPDEFRGFVLADEYAPLVFVNGADAKSAQMFTLAHELAHVFFGSSAAFDLREMQPADDPIEKACNQVAAEFLVPEHILRQIWSSLKEDPEPFQIIARRFKVSVLVGARRALDLALINKNEFLDFYREHERDERRLKNLQVSGGNFYHNQNLRVGKRFMSNVFRAVSEGKLLYSQAYHLTGLAGKTFDNYVDSLRGRGQL